MINHFQAGQDAAKFGIDFHRYGGITLENLETGKELFFQPGDDSGEFCDQLDALSEWNENFEECLAELWALYS